VNDDVRRSRTAFLWVGLIAPLALLVAAAVAIASWMPSLPDPMAIHWGDDGVNGFATKWSYIPLVLGIGAAVVVLTALLAWGAHRLPQSSAGPVIGPWSPTTRFMGALNLGLAALIAFIALAGAWVQRGLPDAADAPGIGIPTLIGFALLVMLAVVGWFLQPPSPVSAADEALPAGSIALDAGTRAAWFGTATMARTGVVVLVASLALLAVMTVFFAIVGEDSWWLLATITLLMALLIGTMVVFRVRVNAQGLRVRSLLGWPNTRIPLQRIEKIETVQLDPLREFGGWGWRIAVDGRRGVVLRAGEALQVTRTDGRIFVVTVDGALVAAAALETLRTHAKLD